MTKLTVETVTIEPVISSGVQHGSILVCRYDSEDGKVDRYCESHMLPIGGDTLAMVICLEKMAKMIREDVINIERNRERAGRVGDGSLWMTTQHARRARIGLLVKKIH